MGSKSRQSGIDRRWRWRRWCALAAGGVIAGLATAAGADDNALVRVDQLHADLDPLSISLRQLQPDFRQDLGFEHLYVEAGDPQKFVRVSGALYAVSAHTEYVALRSGVYPAVAPGTVFYIGPPPEESAPVWSTPSSSCGMSIDVSPSVSRAVSWARPVEAAPATIRVSAQAPSEPIAVAEGAPVKPTQPIVHDMSNPSYRAARLRQIARLTSGAE